jgi:hypothetical protein
MFLINVVLAASVGFDKSSFRITESNVPAAGQNDSWCVPLVCIKRTRLGGTVAAGAANALFRNEGTASVTPAAWSRLRRENCGRCNGIIDLPCAG